MLRDAAMRHGSLQTLGPLAHNRVLLSELEELGVRTVTSPEELTGPVVVVSAHGVAPDVMRLLHERGFTVIDTTCPNVARAQHIVADMAREGLTIVIFGDEHHSEVRGLLGWAGANSIATRDASTVCATTSGPLSSRIGIISQTTQREEEFISFVEAVCAALLPKSREIRIVNTLCDATRRRQEAAAELARTVDAMIVIGGHNSANTQRLAETCSDIVETYLVESVQELDAERLRGKSRLGLTAGASTPDSSIEQVERMLSGL
jgi:4-hydroxy-3-methylbut-2-en-1-yl diphosphate reductase